MSGLTVKSIFVAFLGLVVTALLFGDPQRRVWIAYEFLGIDAGWESQSSLFGCFGMGVLFMLILAVVNQGAAAGWWKTRFTRQEAALVLIMVIVAGVYTGNYHGPFREWFSESAQVAQELDLAKRTELWSYMPDVVFGPKDANFWTFFVGEPGRPKLPTLMIPWAELIPMMATAIFFVLGGTLCLVFASMLLRRLYCTVEYLPMPITEVMTGFLELTQPGSEKVKLFKSKPFIIGLLVSFLYTFPLWGIHFWQTILTGKPAGSLEGSLGGFYLWPLWDFTVKGWLPWVPLRVSLAPWEVGWGMILPINVLASTLIGYLAMFVIFPLIYGHQLGFWGTFPAGMTAVGLTNEGIYRQSSEGFSFVAISIGMLFALVAAPLIMNWHEVTPIFKALIREPPEEFDPDRPISYRLTWLLTIGFGLLWYLTAILVMGMAWHATLFFMAVTSIIFLGYGRMVSETGGWYGVVVPSQYRAHGGLLGAWTLKGFGVMPDPAKPVGSIVTYWHMQTRSTTFAWGDKIPWYSLHSMKVADLTKTKARAALKMLVAGIALSLTAIAVFYWIYRAYSTMVWKTRGELTLEAPGNVEKGETKGYYNMLAHMDLGLIQVAIGFAVILALSLLQPRIPLLRTVSMGGLVWGASGGYMVWATWLLALIIKYIVLKIGGTRMYGDTVKPLSLGLVAGGLLSLVLMMIGSFLIWVIYGYYK